MAQNTKTVYVCYNDKGETLYNKVTGTWNDGKGARNGSSVWTFSAKKPKEESSTIIKAAEHLAKLGFENVTFVLAEVAIDEKGRASIITDEVPFGQETEVPVEPEAAVTAIADKEPLDAPEDDEVIECGDKMISVPMNDPDAADEEADNE